MFLVNSESPLILPFVKYLLNIRCSHCIRCCIFLYFAKAKNPSLVTQNFSKFSICVEIQRGAGVEAPRLGFAPTGNMFSWARNPKKKEGIEKTCI